MEIITGKIDCSKIAKEKLFKGKPGKDGKCPMYLDIVLIPTRQSNFGDERDENTHMIVQSVTKEERLAGKKGNILGNAKCLAARATPAPAATAPPAPDDDPSEIPF